MNIHLGVVYTGERKEVDATDALNNRPTLRSDAIASSFEGTTNCFELDSPLEAVSFLSCIWIALFSAMLEVSRG